MARFVKEMWKARFMEGMWKGCHGRSVLQLGGYQMIEKYIPCWLI